MAKNVLNVLVGFGLLLVVLGLIYLIPWKFTWQQARTITVTGTAQTQKTNEVARFTAGVNAVNDDKQRAIDEVNTKISALIETVKQFGIADRDIKTQNLSIYQMQESEPGSMRQRLGQWSVNNTVEITLREVVRANELTDLLSQSGANNVYGPNFSLDDSADINAELMTNAVNQAKSKAEAPVQATGARLGKVVSVSEGAAVGSQPIPMFDKGMGGGGGAATEVGSSTVSKTVTVTYELR